MKGDLAARSRGSRLPRANTIAIGRDVRRAMIAHARRDAPRECCGLLIGTPGRIVAALACRNLSRSASRYRLDPRDHIRIRRDLRGSRHDVVGVYHSHPRGPEQPSPTDVGRAYYHQWIYAIVSLRGGRARVGAFRMRAARAERLSLVTTAPSPYRAGV
jgi:proteasome lid subunit RPN8/RPN11